MSASLVPQNALSRIVEAALAGLAPHTRRVYSRHIRHFLAYLAQGHPLTRETALVFLSGQTLEVSSYNQALSALKRLVTEAAENGWIDWPTARTLDTLPAKRTRGIRSGVWLNQGDAERLWAAPDLSTLQGQRDRAVLALLLGCGLRRSEVSSLQVSQVVERSGRHYLANLLGKGNRVRTLALSTATTRALLDWQQAARISTGPLVRSFTTDGQVSQRALSTTGVWNVVLHYSEELSLGIAPHDLRRTFAKLARSNGAPLEVIQRSLGHASVVTTERYTNCGEEANAGDYLKL